MNKETKVQAIICLIVAMALWGSSFIALKIAFAELPPLWVIFARMALGSAVFLAAWRWRGRVEYRPGDWKHMLALAVFEPCLYFVFEALALQNTSASQAGMVTALLPLMVAVGAAACLGERISRTSVAGFLLAVAGTVWLTLAGTADEHAPRPLLGNFYEFLAMACATCHVLLLKHLSQRYSAFILTAMQAFIGTPFFLLLALLSGPPPSAPSLTSASAVLYLGLIVTVGAYGLYNHGVGLMPASQASAFINLIPLFTLLIAAMVLGERLNAQQLFGATLVFAGVALSQWPRRNTAAPPAIAGTLD